MIRMPGQSFSGPLPTLTAQEADLMHSLRRDVEKLAGEIGERNYWRHAELSAAADWVETSFEAAGHRAHRQTFDVDRRPCCNVEAEIAGTARADEIVVIGAHYDSVLGSPGANDNASAVAALLALARAFSGKAGARTLRFVAFTNEEPPFFRTRDMGSLVYARRCRERREKVVAMLSLETMGYYSHVQGSQRYPFPFSLFYPATGDFVAFVGNVASRRLVREVVGLFRRDAAFPSEGAAIPGLVTGVGWSDHWAFWRQGFPALMVTDTALFRYPYYHTASDTPDKLEYEGLARVVSGLEKVIASLVE